MATARYEPRYPTPTQNHHEIASVRVLYCRMRTSVLFLSLLAAPALADQVPILPPVHEFNERYLSTKREKLGHRFPD